MLKQHKVLVTGAAGSMGGFVRDILRGQVAALRLSDIAPLTAQHGEEVWPADLADVETLQRAMTGMDAVVHLAASLNADDWQQTLDVNIAGTYKVYEAARRAGVRRVIYASSHHAVGMYPVDQRIGIDVRLRPDSLYGLSKCFGEALAQYHWDKFGLESVCWRIGSARAALSPREPREFITWLSLPDLERLLQASLTTQDVGCSVVYGMSQNGEVWWDNAEAAHLGFSPQDRAVLPQGSAPQAYPLQGGKRAMLGLLQGKDRLCEKP
jgi:uronate dehydrogenase